MKVCQVTFRSGNQKKAHKTIMAKIASNKALEEGVKTPKKHFGAIVTAVNSKGPKMYCGRP